MSANAIFSSQHENVGKVTVAASFPRIALSNFLASIRKRRQDKTPDMIHLVVTAVVESGCTSVHRRKTPLEVTCSLLVLHVSNDCRFYPCLVKGYANKSSSPNYLVSIDSSNLRQTIGSRLTQNLTKDETNNETRV